MAGMAVNVRTCLEMIGNGWQLLGMAGMAVNGWNLVEIDENELK